MARYWVIAPVESKRAALFEKVWQFDLANGVISIGWSEVGDVSQMDRVSLSKAIAATYPEKPPATKALFVNMLWDFWHEIRPGDLVLARKGRKILAAVGKVVRSAAYEPGRDPHLKEPNYAHHGFLEIEWQENPRDKVFPDLAFAMITVREVSEGDYQKLTTEDDILPLQTSLEDNSAVEDEASFALEKHLEDFIIDNFDTIFKGDFNLVQEEGMDAQQYSTEIGPIDILAFEPRSSSFVVIELKKGRPSDQVVGQVMRYMGWVRKNLCTNGQGVKGLIICQEHDKKLSYALDVATNIEVRYYEVSFNLHEKPRSIRA
jgi:restriction system protein